MRRGRPGAAPYVTHVAVLQAVKSHRPAGGSVGEEMRGREWKSERQMIFVSSLALYFIVWTAAVLAQTGSRAESSNPPDEPGKTPEVTCAGVAVFSAGGGPEVHVLRRGMLDQRNPLAPSTNVPPATVLEVTIRGKLAAAYGPTFQEMRRAGPPQELEREIGNPIRWEPNLAELPHDILVLGDTREVIANLRYLKCLPGRKQPPAPEERAKSKPRQAPSAKEQGPAFQLPRGALE